MSPRVILTFLRISVNILYYVVAVCFILYASFIIITQFRHKWQAGGLKGPSFHYEVRDFQKGAVEFPDTYTTDSVVWFHGIRNHFSVNVKSDSGMGYYLMVMKLVLSCFGIAILWNFKRIFQQINLKSPFNHVIIRRLKTLVLLFILSDFLKIADYIIFNQLLRQHVMSSRFELSTSVGNGIITGLIIYLVVVIFQQGFALQEENALTV